MATAIEFKTPKGTPVLVRHVTERTLDIDRNYTQACDDIVVEVAGRSMMRPELVKHETAGWCIAGGLNSLARDTYAPVSTDVLPEIQALFGGHAERIEHRIAALAADNDRRPIDAERAARHDALINEGGEGYNPYRSR